MFKDVLRADFKREIASRILSIPLLLNSGLVYQPDQFLTTNLGQKFNVEGRCSLTNQPILSFVFRDDPAERRSIVIGVSNGSTETFSHYAGSANGPARVSDDQTGKIKDLEGRAIEIIGGNDYQVNVYPAVSSLPRDQVIRIPELRSSQEVVASKAIKLPECTSP